MEKPSRTIVSGALIHPDGTILLVKRTTTKGKRRPGQWELPGGKLEITHDGALKEVQSDALEREFFEETGLRVEKIKGKPIHKVNTYYQEEARKFLIFLVNYKNEPSKKVVLDEDEHSKHEWLSKEQVITHAGLSKRTKKTILTAFEHWEQTK